MNKISPSTITERTAATLAAAITDAERETHYNNVTFIILALILIVCEHAPHYQMK